MPLFFPEGGTSPVRKRDPFDLPGSALGVFFLVSALFPVMVSCEGETPISNWEVAGPYPADQVNREVYPNFYAIFLAPWSKVPSGLDGVVDLNGLFPRENTGGDLALARRVFTSHEEAEIELELECSGETDVFLNGWPVFSTRGRSAGSEDQPPGGSGPTHRVSLPLEKGLNEVLLMISSQTEEWAFRGLSSRPLPSKRLALEPAEEVWATPDTFLTPESVLKDPTRDLLYVTNFDNQFGQKPEPSGYVSILSMDGEILEHRWVAGLSAPTGMDIWRDTLFVAEREHLLAIDLGTGEVAGRWPIPDPVFPNDLVIDESGTVYISDTRTDDWADSRIYRFKEGQFDIFANEGISRANGLWISDGWLIVGSSGDGLLKRVELSTGRVETIVSLGAGIIDGIRVDEAGNYLVSHWEGQLYRISPSGEIVELLDSRPDGWNTADFEFLPERNLVLFPTFLDNRVRAVHIGGGPS